MFKDPVTEERDHFKYLLERQQLFEGLLACDLLGFHIRLHGINFLDAVSQAPVPDAEIRTGELVTTRAVVWPEPE